MSLLFQIDLGFVHQVTEPSIDVLFDRDFLGAGEPRASAYVRAYRRRMAREVQARGHCAAASPALISLSARLMSLAHGR